MNVFTGIFALVIGTACSWMSLKLIRLYLKVKRWERVKARLSSKEMFIHPKYSSSRSPYGLKAAYTYEVNGREYAGHLIYTAELTGGQVNHMKSTAERKLAELEDLPLIYVDPKDPNRSVIYCQGIGLYVFVLFMGLFALLYGLISLLA